MNYKDRGMIVAKTLSTIKWSGLILENSYFIKEKYRITSAGNFALQPVSNIYYLAIPEGATKLKITSTSNLNNSNAYQCGYAISITSTTVSNTASAAYWKEQEFEIPNKRFSYFAISISQNCNPTFTFS